MGNWRTGDWEGNCPQGEWLEGREQTCRGMRSKLQLYGRDLSGDNR